MTWLDELMELTAEVESPRSFIWWAGISTISAVVQNRVWLDKYYYKLYPNTYIFTVAPSGLKKGFPVELSKALVRAVGGRKLISGRSSIQAIVTKLASAETQKNGGPPLTGSQGYIASGEFSTALVRDQDSLTILTDLHDGHYNKEWEYTLKHSGVEKLTDVCVTLLGAMNDTHFEDIISEKEITGGFIARTLICMEEKRGFKNSLTRPPKKKFDYGELLPHLRVISKVSGQFTWSEEAREVFDAWYYEFEPEQLDDKTGTANRIHDQILKVAMCLSLARGIDLILSLEDIEEAMSKVIALGQHLKHVTHSRGKSQSAPQTKTVLSMLLKAPDYKMSRQKILRKGYQDFSAPELDSIIDTFLEAKIILTPYRGGAGKQDVIYELDPDVIAHYRRLEEQEKNK